MNRPSLKPSCNRLRSAVARQAGCDGIPAGSRRIAGITPSASAIGYGRGVIQPVIPPRRTRTKHPKRGRPLTYNRTWYRGRNVIERCVGWLKEWRSVATRFDTLAVNYLQTVKLAMLMRYLRLLA